MKFEPNGQRSLFKFFMGSFFNFADAETCVLGTLKPDVDTFPKDSQMGRVKLNPETARGFGEVKLDNKDSPLSG